MPHRSPSLGLESEVSRISIISSASIYYSDRDASGGGGGGPPPLPSARHQARRAAAAAISRVQGSVNLHRNPDSRNLIDSGLWPVVAGGRSLARPAPYVMQQQTDEGNDVAALRREYEYEEDEPVQRRRGRVRTIRSPSNSSFSRFVYRRGGGGGEDDEDDLEATY